MRKFKVDPKTINYLETSRGLAYTADLLLNGEKVKTLDEFRTAVRKSKTSRFLTIKTKQHWRVVFSVDNIVKNEDRLAKMYQFKKSKLIDDIA